MTDLTLRRNIGRPLEWEEMDVNMENLDSDSPWNVASGHIWYSGKISLYGTDATYDLDFTNGVANVATIGTNDADLEVHVDGARKFKVITNSQNRFQITTDGKVGINIDSDPSYDLDVDGSIRARTTFFANQVDANSFYDGIASLSGGSLTNAVNGEFTGQVRFGSLYDITNDHIVRELDVSVLTDNSDHIPTSRAVSNVFSDLDSNFSKLIDSVQSELQQNIDSVNNSLILNVDQLQTNIDSVNNSLILNVDQLQTIIDSVSSSLTSTDLQDVTDVSSSTTNDITAPHFVGELTGSLTNARNINGTSFDASADITTAQWGTARDISIGGTSKSVNGSGNYTWTSGEITAGKVSNSFTVQGTSFDGSAAQSVTFTGSTGVNVTGTTITATTATAGTRGSIKIGYAANGKNYPVQLSSEQAFVNVPWTNTTYTAGNGLTLDGTAFKMSGSYSGTFTATGDVVAFSDMALKEDINPISAALEKVTQLTGYTFRRKGEEKVSTGVMAQEVQKVLPEAVHDNEGTLGVAYGNMVGLLIEAVKELSGKVESLESELNRTK